VPARLAEAAARRTLLGLIRAYQLTLSPWLGRRCRFEPTCSQYAAEAIARHGAARGAALAARRLARCHPWGGSGYDPVPPIDAPDE
jgi:putative membrane protein insertion efficiency factor